MATTSSCWSRKFSKAVSRTPAAVPVSCRISCPSSIKIYKQIERWLRVSLACCHGAMLNHFLVSRFKMVRSRMILSANWPGSKIWYTAECSWRTSCATPQPQMVRTLQQQDSQSIAGGGRRNAAIQKSKVRFKFLCLEHREIRAFSFPFIQIFSLLAFLTHYKSLKTI